MSLAALVEKEVYDLVREKRFGAWALAYTTVWAGVMIVILIEAARRSAYGGGPESFYGPGMGIYYVTVIGLAVLGLFLCTDGVCREREAGTLPLVATTPVSRAHVLVSKLAAAGAAYVAALVVVLVATSMLTVMYGTPLVILVLQLFALPFLAFYVFLAGVGLLIGVVASSSKVAIGISTAIYFPLFFIGGESPFQALFAAYPAAAKAAALTPFSATYGTFQALLWGGYVPWDALAVTAGTGVVAAAAAFAIFARQEGAA